MKAQNYQNHLKWYVPHHFIFYPAVTVLMIIALVQSFRSEADKLLWLMLAGAFVIVALLSLMMRQHYALGNQNRVVRLEMRLRYYILTQKRFEAIEKQLSQPQLFALRFAPDEELLALIDRAVKENISGDEIKKSIKNWVSDEMRV